MSQKNKPLRYLILDTCIFDHLGNSDLFPQIISLLRDALSKGYGISMSIYTLLELIDTASIENEVKATQAISGVKRFRINHTILVTAGHLGCMYKDDGISKVPEKGDKIIAATSVIHNALIFTTNGRDFPEPFFHTISKPLLTYRKYGRDVCLISYFIEPDYIVLEKKYQERVDEHAKKHLPVPEKSN
jgi:predicted nucleic acid-binding protein